MFDPRARSRQHGVVTKRALRKILAKLESPDAFERLDAEQSLRHLTQRDFGFRWDDPEEDRSSALDRIRDWAEARNKPAVDPAGDPATLDLEQLKKMSPQQMEEHLQALLAKAKFVGGFQLGRPRCEDCRKRPATVHVVECSGRTATATSQLCDPCAVSRGEVREG